MNLLNTNKHQQNNATYKNSEFANVQNTNSENPKISNTTSKKTTQIYRKHTHVDISEQKNKKA